MTTTEVAARFSELAKENNFSKIQDELYAEDAESIEPAHAAAVGLKNAKGLDAIRKKGAEWEGMVEQVHSGYCSEPVVAGNHFAVAMGMEVTMKGAGRMNMDEIAVYEVKHGKITREQFFF